MWWSVCVYPYVSLERLRIWQNPADDFSGVSFCFVRFALVSFMTHYSVSIPLLNLSIYFFFPPFLDKEVMRFRSKGLRGLGSCSCLRGVCRVLRVWVYPCVHVCLGQGGLSDLWDYSEGLHGGKQAADIVLATTAPLWRSPAWPIIRPKPAVSF